MNQRAFGVEIECYGGFNVEGTERLLKGFGYDWVVDYDGSEVEIKTPILKGAKGIRDLKTVFGILNRFDFYTTEDDGLHVHHDVSDLNIDQLITIGESWIANQNTIVKMVDKSRNNCYYAPRLESVDFLYEEKKTGRFMWADEDERANLNFDARQTHGTLEIRLHEGTLNFEQARAWILFGQAFISNVARRSNPLPSLTVEELLRATRTYKVARPTLLGRAGVRI